MSDAPEKIWATEDKANFGEDRFHTTRPMKGLTEYTRSDLCVTRADLDAAVALALEGAAAEAEPWCGPPVKSNIVNAQSIAAQQIKARIRARIPAAGTAELERIRHEAHNAAIGVKPLVWTHYAADETYPEAWCADCCGGFYTVLRDGESSHRWITPNGVEHDDDLESAAEAKAAAQADYTTRILAAHALPVDGGAKV